MSRVALIGENSIEFVDLLLNIWNSGDCAVLIDWRIPIKTAIEMMKDANVQECYIEKKFYDRIIVSMTQRVKIIPFDKKINSAAYLPSSVYDKFQKNYSTDEAIVIYSSGTTGKSKGIILSHFAINTNADAIIDYMHLKSDDCIYIVKSLSHSSTLTGELLVSLKTRTNLIIAPIIVPPRYIFENISKFCVSMICLNPILLSILIEEIERGEYDVNTLKAIYVSGSLLNDKLCEKARRAFPQTPVYNIYGLSEAGPRVSAQNSKYCTSNSVGKSINGVEITIVNENGMKVVNYEHGIVHVNTPSVFNGYISGHTRKSLYKNWLNTGDLGYFDRNGELYITGRVDDLIIFEAHKIFPEEIENIILNIDGILECLVTSVEYNNNKVIVCLYVGDDLSEKNIRRSLMEKLPNYEIPKRFIRCSEMPRNPNGKISRKTANRIVSEIIKGDS